MGSFRPRRKPTARVSLNEARPPAAGSAGRLSCPHARTARSRNHPPGLAPHLEGRRVVAATLRRPDLRWPIPPEIRELLPGQRIDAVRRRAKYLLLDTAAGSALLHLGMSGSLRVLPGDTPVRDHDHVDLVLDSSAGAALQRPAPLRLPAVAAAGETHPLLAGLGPEPLSRRPSTAITCSRSAAAAARR